MTVQKMRDNFNRLLIAALVATSSAGLSEARAQALIGKAPSKEPLDLRPGSSEEKLTVYGLRRHYLLAPIPDRHLPGYGEGSDHIRDTMTGADLSAFGDAYNLGSAMGSDERSNETGGGYLPPKHN